MNITVQDQDGKDPLPICLRYRQWLIDHYQSATMIVSRFFTDDPPIHARKKVVTEEHTALKHLHECPRCRAWVPTIVSEEAYHRQARLVRYCCAGMFCAVEEYMKYSIPQFSFHMFRG